MRAALPPGRFLGHPFRTYVSPDLRLTEIRYTAGAPAHAHERPYLCLIHGGRYTERFGRRQRICESLTVAWHPPGMQHTITLERPVNALNLEPGPTWLGWMLDHGFATDAPSDTRGGPVAEAGTRLAAAMDQGGDPLTVEALTAEVVAALCRFQAAEWSRRPGWLADAPDLFDGDNSAPRSLRDLAAAAGVHPVHFAAVFRRCYGCSVGDYLRRRRVAQARRSLAELDRPLAEVAAAVGFADQSHLTRAFKRYTGMTPGAYRTSLARHSA